jgi:CheY-like chemotaxis protein/two-component sensor histidine kinase
VDELRLMMTTHSARIAILLDQLLDVARVSSGRMEIANDRVDLNQVIRAAVGTVRALAENDDHQIVLSLPFDETALVRGDVVRLTQVVENLLTNAVRYTETGGKIDVALVVEGKTVRLSVRDTGIGMTAEFIPRVFDVFAQEQRALRSSKGGLGLGLALVRRLVELHGGEISASSPGPGQGSEFTVTLPRLKEKHPQRLLAGASVPAGPVKIRPRRILVVDDEKDAARALAGILEFDGHQTLVVPDGQAALKAMRTFDPEVVLLDLGLPGMDGYQTATRLRAEYRDKRAHLIAVTGYRDDVARLKEAGFDAHLLKPPNLQKLASLLAAWDDEGGVG